VKKLLLLLLLALPALARELYWDSIHVRAHLDAQDTLHVREAQTYVFNGDWNGGEREVALLEGIEFHLDSLSRVDEYGQLVPLSEGSLDVVDGYQVDGSQIRWRSRLPSDPPFENRRITYVLDYTLTNVLLKRFNRYYLKHNFIFPTRPGEIRRLTVDLDLDPAWHSDNLQSQYRATDLAPGKSFIVRGSLAYRGPGPPPNARLDTLPLRLGLVTALMLLPLAFWQLLLRREEKLGRFAPLDTAAVTPKWIGENLLPIPAEVVGAAWDESVEANEVSALIARWVAEGKVESSASSKNLKLELIAERDSFEGYERDLIEKLFADGNSTSTSKLRTHYKDKGFSPTDTVRGGVTRRAEELAQLQERAPLRGGLITAALFFAAIYVLVDAWKTHENFHVAIVITSFMMGIFMFIGSTLAVMWRGAINKGREDLKAARVAMAIVLVAVIVIVVFNLYPLDLQIGFTLLALMIASRTANSAKSKRGPSAIAFRKKLAAARQYFAEELAKSDPAIDDQWFPWVIAFGLDKDASKWAKKFGVDAARPRSSSSSYSTPISSSSSSSSSRPSWSGGGGAFGGAGATGTWSVAASGLAAGVAAPRSSGSGSSSSGGGGGGGGGGSSGGGSGGGW